MKIITNIFRKKLSYESYYFFWLTLVIIIFIRLLLFTYLSETDFTFVESGDTQDYLSTAHNIVSGNGFVSIENNATNRRAYLGDNYYYVGEPVYPLFLAPFLLVGISNEWIVLLSNLILYAVILWAAWRILINLKINFKWCVIIFTSIIINPHLEYFSFKMLPELLRITVLLIYFLALLLITKNKYNNKKLIILGLLGGLLILTRITFLFIPFLVVPVIIKHIGKKPAPIIAYVLTVILTLTPWIYRNYHDFGLVTIDVRFNAPKGEYNPKAELASVWRITDNEKFWEFQREKDPNIRAKMLENVENSPLQWVRMYGLRLWEIFKPFPTGGSYNKLLLITYSMILYIPWFSGLLLFICGRIKIYKPIHFWFSLGLLSFIGMHLLQNSPHARYMLPLVPLGYIFFSVKIQEKFRPSVTFDT